MQIALKMPDEIDTPTYLMIKYLTVKVTGELAERRIPGFLRMEEIYAA